MKWLAVFAVILKFIGIAVLLLLAILLLVIFVVLLSAIKYEAVGDYGNGRGKGKAYISYLFGLVRFDMRYDGTELCYNVKIPFVDTKKLLSGSEKNENTEKKEASADKVNEALETEKTPFEAIEQTDSISVKAMQEDKSTQKKHKHKTANSGKSKDKKARNIKRIYNKAVSVCKEYEPVKLYKPIKRFLKRFFKAMGVKTALVDATFGFEDPSLTGIVLGGSSVLAAFVPITLNLSGHFDGSYLNGNARLRGKTCLLALAVPIIRLVFEKPVWNILTKLKG
jgi:hypothetical protein